MKRLKNSKSAKFGLHIAGFILSIFPPVICTASYFPIWKSGGEAISGMVLILLLISALPLYKFLKRALASPASYTIWLILFLLFFSLSKIADEMTVISFVGLVGNALGAVLFNLAKKCGGDKNE